MSRTTLVSALMLALSGCAPPAAPPAPGAPSAAPHVELGRFEGDVDVVRGTITFSTPETDAAGVHPDGTLTYGTASGQLYMHTVSAAYDNGNVAGTHPCSAGSGQIYLCAQVQAVSAYSFALSNIESVVTPTSTGVTAIGGPYVYGSVTANGSSASAGVKWLFSLPSSSNFHFTGSATGDYWSSAPSLNTARTGHAATVLNTGVVLVVGGGTTSNFNLVTATASSTIPRPRRRRGPRPPARWSRGVAATRQPRCTTARCSSPAARPGAAGSPATARSTIPRRRPSRARRTSW